MTTDAGRARLQMARRFYLCMSSLAVVGFLWGALQALSEGRRVAIEFVSENGSYRIVNAIPLARAGGAPAEGAQHGGMQGGMMGHDMAGMKEMCEGMMGGDKRWWQFWR